MIQQNKNISASPAEVTVIVPVYNHAHYVVEALESVRLQTCPNWEMIVIDDGSTDDSWSVLMQYESSSNDPRIRFFKQENVGSHATINRGLSMVRTPYLAILNSDDKYHTDRLASLLSLAKQQQGDCFIATGCTLIDENGKEHKASHWWNAMHADTLDRWHNSVGVTNQDRVVASLLHANFTVSTSNFFMSSGVLKRVGQFRHFRYVPDWDFALRVATESEIQFIFAPDLQLLQYRMHGENTILGGALRNHAEASHVLRSFQRKWTRLGKPLTVEAIDRLHYLRRFIRHEHARQMLERQKVGWLEQVDALKTDRARIIDEASATKISLEAERKYWQTRSNEWEAYAQQLKDSTSFRITAPLRWAKLFLQTAPTRARTLVRRVFAKFRRVRLAQPALADAYTVWLKAESESLAVEQANLPTTLKSLKDAPVFSLVMPVHNTKPAHLREAIRSVRAQWYEQWQLCICDDGSTDPGTLAALAESLSSDDRIRCVRRDESGHIAVATNEAIALATGDYIAFLDHDDCLPPNALLEYAKQLDISPDIDLLYSDEDKINEAGERSLPFFKPDWSPALLWSQNYVGHLTCVRASLLKSLGGLAPGTQGSQDHDLVLRLASVNACIRHVPKILYHWRMHAASTSISASAKPYAHTAGKEAVARHLLSRYGHQFKSVEDGHSSFVYEPRFKVPEGALASIVIPTRDKVELLKACVDSIFARSSGVEFEIIIVDNGSVESETAAYFSEISANARIKLVKADIPFNWSRLNNIGRLHSRGSVLVFLNNDTEVISPDWLVRLMEYALLPDVATVGPLLLYPDETIQHAGVIVGMGGWADHVFKAQEPIHFPSPFVSSVIPRNVMASTGACLAIATQRFDSLGGFDEAFQICGSDVEIAIRGHKQGLWNVYLPTVRLYHLESKTRTPHVPEVDFQQSRLKYAPFRTEGDPFFNVNLHPGMTSPTPIFPAQPSTSEIKSA